MSMKQSRTGARAYSSLISKSQTPSALASETSLTTQGDLTREQVDIHASRRHSSLHTLSFSSLLQSTASLSEVWRAHWNKLEFGSSWWGITATSPSDTLALAAGERGENMKDFIERKYFPFHFLSLKPNVHRLLSGDSDSSIKRCRAPVHCRTPEEHKQPP